MDYGHYKARERPSVDDLSCVESPFWICWQCHYKCTNERDLVTHLPNCPVSAVVENADHLVGCPFCPSDGSSTLDPIIAADFDEHLKLKHADVTSLKCPYCCAHVTPPKILELTIHIMDRHCLHWRPSPHSISFMRVTSQRHRELSCVGCGNRSFVLRAEDFASPSSSLANHMDRCSGRGGQVLLEKLPDELIVDGQVPPDIVKRLIRSAKLKSWQFNEQCPTHRGFSKRPKALTAQIQQARPALSAKGAVIVAKKSDEPTPKPKSAAPTSKPSEPATTKPTETANKFDVSIDLPPQKKKAKGTKLFVCPICATNSKSLRERDEHLQSSHNMELVFPCQLCGQAYPLYIALRRHAAKDHSSNYDGVMYGEHPDNEPFECNKCHLVSFTDQTVLKRHLKIVHGVAMGRPKQPDDPNKPKRGRGRPPKNPTGEPSGAATSGTLEKEALRVPRGHNDCTCDECGAAFSNIRERFLHREMEHGANECQQLACQACGRVFFGDEVKLDLIGHMSIVHQSTGLEVSAPMKCSVETCAALFTSTKLRKVHACPMPEMIWPEWISANGGAAPVDLQCACDPAALATEVLADQANKFLLAYACPNCSYIFTGERSTERFLAHRQAKVCERNA